MDWETISDSLCSWYIQMLAVNGVFDTFRSTMIMAKYDLPLAQAFFCSSSTSSIGEARNHRAAATAINAP